jgi:mono/diheme cytochrome c family protein
VDARMPQFDLNDDEVEALMTFLKSRTSDKVPAAFMANSERRMSVAHGDQLMEYFNCRGCHIIDGLGGAVRDVYAEDDIYRAPPVLQSQGWRVQPDWLFSFLKDPSDKLRPWLDIRMPTFPLTDQRGTTLVKSFAAGSNVAFPYLTVDIHQSSADREEARQMVAELGCFKCHTAGKPSPDQDMSSLAPDLNLAKQRLRPDWVAAWLKNPQALQEGTRMPSFFTPDAMETVMYPKYFGGSQEKQIHAIAEYVMSLQQQPAQAAAAAPAKKTAPKRGGGGRGGSR